MRLLGVLLAALIAAACLAAPAAAPARVAVVASGTSEGLLLDVVSSEVAARLRLPAPAVGAAVAPDGRRGFWAAGTSVVAVDLDKREVAAQRNVGGAVLGVAAAGARVVAVTASDLIVLGGPSLTVVHRVGLRGTASGAVAASPGGGLAAAVLRSGRVAVVDAAAGRLLRRVRVPAAAGVAVDGAKRTWVATARGRLQLLEPGTRKVRGGKGIKLGAGLGGALDLSPDGARLAVGAARGAPVAGVVELGSGRVRRFLAGRGPGGPAWAPDGSRLYVADAGAGAISLVSPFALRRIGVVALTGTTPRGLAVQPGLARIFGTEGADQLRGSRGRDELTGFAGDDQLLGGRDNDVLVGDEGNDVLVGGTYDDRLAGGAGDDQLRGESGNDRLDGGDGNDTFDGGTGDDRAEAGTGNDKMDGGVGDDFLFGGAGDDEIVETSFGNDRRLYGGPGNDLVRGGRGSDRKIRGGDGDDRLFGESGTENIGGGDGNDLVDGGRARDLLAGNNGDDTIVAGSGRDTVEGGAGNDIIRAADRETDEIDCGPGTDTAVVEDALRTPADPAEAPQVPEGTPPRPRDVIVDCETVEYAPPDTEEVSIVRGTNGDDVLRGTPDVDSLFGKNGNDRLFAGGGDDYVDGENDDDELHGGPGDDIMAGRNDDDRIFGDEGNDRITGDRGEDEIDGGAGDDQLFGNLDYDIVRGGRGRDRINVVRGGVDTVDCGLGRDVVFADPVDRVARSCEDVRR